MIRVVAVVLAACCAAPLAAQSVRLRTVTTARYAELRPIRYDTASGTFQADSVASAVPLTEDVELSAWGLGVPGLRAYALVRGRAALGSELVWPRFDDHFDALYAFVELERDRYRLRAGRQQRASGLGLYAFDGLTATFRPWATVRLEGYGGRGLARGFLEPAGSPAIRSLDPLIPEQGTILLGTSLWVAPSPRSSFSAIYQRELLSDRSGLASERAALDGRVSVGRAVISGSVDADLGARAWGKARMGALLRLDHRSFVEVEVFRYRPLLDLTTIWGVFAPEAHKGITAGLNFAPGPRLSLSSSFTYRRFQPVTVAVPFVQNLPDNAEQLTLGAQWHGARFSAQGSYQLQLGFGGAQSGGTAAVAYGRAESWSLGVQAAAFRQDGAFRVTDGTVYGAGLDARGPIGERMYVRGDVMRYLHRRMSGQTAADWDQTRAQLSLEMTFGANPDRVRTPQ